MKNKNDWVQILIRVEPAIAKTLKGLAFQAGLPLAVYCRELLAAGLSHPLVAKFHCPAGLDFGTNHPHEIALSIAAQLVTERDRLTKPTPGAKADQA